MIAQQPQQNMQQMYVPQINNPNNPNNNQRQVPVRLSSVNFEGVFTSSRLNMENLISQNLYSNNSNQATSANVIPPQPPNPNRPSNSLGANLGIGSKGTPQQGSQPRKWLHNLYELIYVRISKEHLEHVFLLIDIFKLVLVFHQFLQIFLNIVFGLALHRKHSLTLFFSEFLTVADWNDIRFFEAFRHELEYNIFSIGQSKLEMIFNSLWNHCHLSSFI